MKSDYLETQYYVAELHEGILHVQYKPHIRIGLEDAEVLVAQRLEFFKDLQSPVLIKSARVKSVDKQARSFLFQEGLVNIKALAFIEGHNMDRMLATFLFGFKSPDVPCEMFENEKEALTWLRQYV